MAIDLQYKGTEALADGRRLPSDRGCAGDTAKGHLNGDRADTGDTARGSHCWGPTVGHSGHPTCTRSCGQRGQATCHKASTAAAAARAHPGCVGGPWPCPCWDTAVTCSASPSWTERRPQPSSELFDLFHHLHWPTDHSALGFLSSLIIVP